MVHTPAELLSDAVRDALRSAGLLLDNGTLKAREAERRTGIARNTLQRRLASGAFTMPELDQVAAVTGTTSEELIARARQAAA